MGIGPRRVDDAAIYVPPPLAPAPAAPAGGADLGEDAGPKERQVAAWADRDGPSTPDPEAPAPARDVARVGAGVTPAPGDLQPTDELPSGGRARKVGLFGDRARPQDDDSWGAMPIEKRYPIKSGGMSAADVKAAAAKIDADKDGVISEKEVTEFGKRGMSRGFADQAARDAFRRYEAGAALFTTQAERGVTTKYLDGDWTREMKKTPGANAAEIAEVRKTLLPQADGQIAADVIPELAKIEDAKLDPDHRKAAKGVLRANGYKSVAVIDRDGDGKIGANDRFVGVSASGDVSNGKMMFMDDVRATMGLNKAYAAYSAKPPAFLNPSRPDAFPPSHWDHKSYSGPEGTRVGWELKPGVKASDALREFRKDPSAYKCDCATAKQLFELHALMEQMGERDFDKLCAQKGLFVGYGAAHQDGALAKTVLSDVGDPSMKPREYDPGWMGYAQLSVAGRPDLAVPMADAGWAGEHFAVTVDENGKKNVIAHPFGEIDAAAFESELRKKIATTFGVAEEDVQISYKTPQIYDPAKARDALAP